jgi:peroxiredoxin
MDASSPAAPTDQSYQEAPIRKTIATIGLMALLAVPVFLFVVLQRSANLRTLRAGDSIPVASLGGVDPGDALLAGISGKRATILFFSVDCPHCQREISIFNEAGKRFASEVEFVAIALNDRQKTQTFVRTNDVGARVLIDEKGVVGRLFGVSELPALFLVNQDQKIEWVGVGEQPRTELLRRLSVLAGKGPSTVAQGAENTRK